MQYKASKIEIVCPCCGATMVSRARRIGATHLTDLNWFECLRCDLRSPVRRTYYDAIKVARKWSTNGKK